MLKLIETLLVLFILQVSSLTNVFVLARHNHTDEGMDDETHDNMTDDYYTDTDDEAAEVSDDEFPIEGVLVGMLMIPVALFVLLKVVLKITGNE